MTPEQLEIMGVIRIIEVGGQNAFALYQQGQISLSKLAGEIAEEITTAPELRKTIIRLAYGILSGAAGDGYKATGRSPWGVNFDFNVHDLPEEERPELAPPRGRTSIR
mgnify:CR=1 FL=1